MGTFASNIQIFVGDKAAHKTHSELLTWFRKSTLSQGYQEMNAGGSIEFDRCVTIGPLDKGPWIGVYDEGMSPTEDAKKISKELKVTVIVIALNDSDVLQLFLFNNGKQIDQYNSFPEYGGGKPSKAQRASLRGDLNLWKGLLVPGTAIEQVREVWDSKPVFADDILFATAKFLGMDARFAVGDLETDDEKSITHLTFRLKEKSDPFVKAEAPPDFEPLIHYEEPVIVSEGDWIEISFRVVNQGGIANGLSIIAMGEALEQGFVEVESVRMIQRKKEGSGTIDAQFEIVKTQVDGKPVMAAKASFPEISLHQGVVTGTYEHSEASMRRVAKAYEQATITAYIKCKALKVGQSELVAGLLPTTHPAGQATFRVGLSICPRSRRPLKCSDDASPGYLRMMEQPRRLVGLVSLGTDQKSGAEIATSAIEKWHQAILPLGKGQYEVVISARRAIRPQTKKIKADTLFRSKGWAESRESLAVASLVSATLPSGIDNPEVFSIDFGSGFVFGPGINSSFHGAEKFSPHLGFWVDLRASGAPGLESILLDIIDEVMSQAVGYQAFMVSWDWTPQITIESTPYEMCCGVHGQCTTLREWCAKFLRGVSSEMWLGPSLRERLNNLEELEAVAKLRHLGGCLHLSLKQDTTLGALESALEPLLPTAEDWKNGMSLLYGRKFG